MIYKGRIIDVIQKRIFVGEVETNDNAIADIRECSAEAEEDLPYILPGYIDSHVHVESSMMVPAEFARAAAAQGTIGIITDPHEIANVIGVEGIDFMIRSSHQIKFNFCFGAPSCVPSCGPEYETSGAILDSKVIEELMARPEIGYLSEMMNYPGVLARDPEVMAKIEAARKNGKPVDGHAPSLIGEQRLRYADAGISTEHECSTIEEGRACIAAGMKVLIREGSAAKNYNELIPLLAESPENVMFCTDDSHPSDLIYGHINVIVKRALRDGYKIWDILQAACVNPQKHYNLNWGLLQKGDPATFIVVDTLGSHFRIRQTIINGTVVFDEKSYLNKIKSQSKSIDNQMSILDQYPNHFVAKPISEEDIALPLGKGVTAHIIVAEDGSLLTGHETVAVTGNPMIDSKYPWNEIQKIVVYDRYTEGARPCVGLIRGFGIKEGAMAASIAHDCHNIVAIGSSDEYIVQAINRVIQLKGAQVVVTRDSIIDLALPIAGIISPLSAQDIAYMSWHLSDAISKTGCPMKAPFITMAFMCLPVIPRLKITDKGLFDSEKWEFVTM